MRQAGPAGPQQILDQRDIGPVHRVAQGNHRGHVALDGRRAGKEQRIPVDPTFQQVDQDRQGPLDGCGGRPARLLVVLAEDQQSRRRQGGAQM